MSENTAPEPQDIPEPQDDVEELVDELEVHGLSDPQPFTDPCSGGCTATC
ncbi:hypothetical protein [Nonomuraea sp. JJY05]|jgi:hypothetical protein